MKPKIKFYFFGLKFKCKKLDGPWQFQCKRLNEDCLTSFMSKRSSSMEWQLEAFESEASWRLIEECVPDILRFRNKLSKGSVR